MEVARDRGRGDIDDGGGGERLPRADDIAGRPSRARFRRGRAQGTTTSTGASGREVMRWLKAPVTWCRALAERPMTTSRARAARAIEVSARLASPCS